MPALTALKEARHLITKYLHFQGSSANTWTLGMGQKKGDKNTYKIWYLEFQGSWSVAKCSSGFTTLKKCNRGVPLKSDVTSVSGPAIFSHVGSYYIRPAQSVLYLAVNSKIAHRQDRQLPSKSAHCGKTFLRLSSYMTGHLSQEMPAHCFLLFYILNNRPQID